MLNYGKKKLIAKRNFLLEESQVEREKPHILSEAFIHMIIDKWYTLLNFYVTRRCTRFVFLFLTTFFFTYQKKKKKKKLITWQQDFNFPWQKVCLTNNNYLSPLVELLNSNHHQNYYLLKSFHIHQLQLFPACNQIMKFQMDLDGRVLIERQSYYPTKVTFNMV